MNNALKLQETREQQIDDIAQQHQHTDARIGCVTMHFPFYQTCLGNMPIVWQDLIHYELITGIISVPQLSAKCQVVRVRPLQWFKT